MTSIELHNGQRRIRTRLFETIAQAATGAATRAMRIFAKWHKQRLDRAAFRQLMEQEEWIYRDIGVSRADVEWAARLPRQINAAKELERLRANSMMGR